MENIKKLSDCLDWYKKKLIETQECAFCQNPESILSEETCCKGCTKLEEKKLI